jgi:hypothetical protein
MYHVKSERQCNSAKHERRIYMKNELFTVKPSLSQYYGHTVTKDLEFDEKTDNGEIHQTLKDCVLTTEINRQWEHGGIKNSLQSKQTEILPEGTIIIWSELQGYIVPNVAMYKLKDLEEEISCIKEAYSENTDINPR